jgi:hypothetical protein
MPPVGRSTIFAFTCRLGTINPLTTDTFNPVIGSSTAMQVFSTHDNGTVYVCLRLSKAITRARFYKALNALQHDQALQLQKPEGATSWTSVVFMGRSELGNEGVMIIQTIKADMLANSAAFSQCLGDGNHREHMLTDTLGDIICPFPTVTRPMSPVEGVAARLPSQQIFSPAMVIGGQPNNVAGIVRLAGLLTNILADIRNTPERLGPLIGLADLVQVELDRM